MVYSEKEEEGKENWETKKEENVEKKDVQVK